jgi:hypothetical protein
MHFNNTCRLNTGAEYGNFLNLILKKMKTKKLNLKSIKNVLSQAEMEKIMAGSGKH